MNSIFLVLPIADAATAGSEAVYLRALDREHSMVDFEDMKRIDSLEAMQPIKTDGVEQTGGILCAYANYGQKGSDALLDSDIFLHPQTLNVRNSQGEEVSLEIVACNPGELYKWLAQHRNPKRLLTENYEKHTKNEKDVDGKRVSALTYSREEAEELLQWAVGEKSHNRRYFMDMKRKRLLIFWNQKEANPTFHAYDVDIDDAEETQKMWKECGREIVNRIKTVSNLKA